MKTIMIVDDDQFVRENLIYSIKFFFELLTVSSKVMPEFVEAKNGSQAWYFLTEDKIVPDLMIVDFQMPGMNGDHLIDKIQKELELNSEIAIHSGYFPAEAEAQRLGCRFIPKLGGEKKIFDLALEMGLFVP